MTPPVLMPHNGRGAHFRFALASAARADIALHDLSGMDEFTSAAWRSFCSKYIHLSPNGREFELLCFKRYFYTQSYASDRHMGSFFICDTDVLFFPAFASYTRRLKENGTTLAFSSGQSDSGALHLSPHCSLWTISRLNSFIEFLLEFYDDADRVRKHAKSHSSARDVFAISDMTLLAEWLSASGTEWTDTAPPLDGLVIDHNINLTTQGNTRFKQLFGAKLINFSRLQAAGLTPDGPVQFAVLHFQGKAKAFMAAAMRADATRLRVGLAGLALARRARHTIRAATRAFPQA